MATIQYLIPGGAFVDEDTALLDFLIPGGAYVNETSSGGGGTAYSLSVDPLTLRVNLGSVGLLVTPASQGTGGSLLLLGLQFIRVGDGGGHAYTLSVDPLTLHLNLGDVGLQRSGPQQYSLAVDPLTLHLNLGDVGLSYSPFTPPIALPSVRGRSPYLEYRRHRRMGR